MKNTNLELWWKQSKNAKLAKYWAAEEIAIEYYRELWDNDDYHCSDRHFVKTCWKPIALAQILKKEMMRG